MNKYVRKLFGVMFQSKQTQQVVRMQPQPLPTSPDKWHRYWQAKGFLWQTEPEIDAIRQEELSRYRATIPNIEKGIYPFKGVKLSRADVEWLLATHENGRGPVNWSDESQRNRKGIDLRGADLCGVNLQGLPLARTLGGLNWEASDVEQWSRRTQWEQWSRAGDEQRSNAAVHLERADLSEAHLERAFLRGAHLEGADLSEAHLEEAVLWNAFMEGTNLWFAHLEGAFLLEEVHLEGAVLQLACLQGAKLRNAHLEGADLRSAHLEGADLSDAHLEGKYMNVNDLERVRKSKGDFPEILPPADLRGAYFDSATDLSNAVLGNKEGGFVTMADVHLQGVDLSVLDWAPVTMLGDERLAHARRLQGDDGTTEVKGRRLNQFRTAVRVNRQFAVALQDQGLNEVAAHFAYRAQIIQRKVFWKERKIGRWLFSLVLALLAGYGYRMWRILAAYLIVISACALAYFVLGMYYPPHLSLLQAFLESVIAFHGRVFSELFAPDTPQIWVTAFEAVAGLVIEGVFIAMLTKRFFGK